MTIQNKWIWSFLHIYFISISYSWSKWGLCLSTEAVNLYFWSPYLIATKDMILDFVHHTKVNVEETVKGFLILPKGLVYYLFRWIFAAIFKYWRETPKIAKYWNRKITNINFVPFKHFPFEEILLSGNFSIAQVRLFPYLFQISSIFVIQVIWYNIHFKYHHHLNVARICQRFQAVYFFSNWSYSPELFDLSKLCTKKALQLLLRLSTNYPFRMNRSNISKALGGKWTRIEEALPRNPLLWNLL